LEPKSEKDRIHDRSNRQEEGERPKTPNPNAASVRNRSSPLFREGVASRRKPDAAIPVATAGAGVMKLFGKEKFSDYEGTTNENKFGVSWREPSLRKN
jgi:hypothetical protein